LATIIKTVKECSIENALTLWNPQSYGHVYVSKFNDQLYKFPIYKCPYKEGPLQTINAKLKVKISILFVFKS